MGSTLLFPPDPPGRPQVVHSRDKLLQRQVVVVVFVQGVIIVQEGAFCQVLDLFVGELRDDAAGQLRRIAVRICLVDLPEDVERVPYQCLTTPSRTQAVVEAARLIAVIQSVTLRPPGRSIEIGLGTLQEEARRAPAQISHPVRLVGRRCVRALRRSGR